MPAIVLNKSALFHLPDSVYTYFGHKHGSIQKLKPERHKSNLYKNLVVYYDEHSIDIHIIF